MISKTQLFAILITLLAAGSAVGREVHTNYSSVIVFGDSYEDSGLLYQITTRAMAAHVPGARPLPALLDDPHYWRGHWSNGETLVEVLARRLQVPLRDYAVGGAKSTYGNYDAWIDAYADTGLQGQIDTWQASLKGTHADPNALYLISVSTNDYCQFHDFKQPGVLPVEGVGPLDYGTKGAQTAANVGWAVRRLRASGAQHIVVFSSYAIAESPLIVAVDPQVADARSFAEHFDALLPSAVASADVIIFPIGAAMRDLMTHPRNYGLSDVTHPCQPTIGKSAPACATPDAFFWWDEIHPTARVHTLLAEALLRHLL